LKASGEAGSALFGKYWDAADERGRADAKQRNHTIETIAPAELDKWRPLLQSATDEWLKRAKAKGEDGQKLLDDLKQIINACSTYRGMNDSLPRLVGRLNELITSWLARIAAVALALIAVVTFCDVIARKVFNSGFTFTVEMTEMLMAVIVFLGVGLVTHQHAHIVVDVLTLRLSERSRVWLGLVANVLSLGFVLLMVWRLWVQAAFISSKGDTTPIWNIPLWPIAYLISAGSVFLVTGLV